MEPCRAHGKLGSTACSRSCALLGGCGGGGNTKSDFIARADGICTSTLRQTRALVPPASTSQPGGAQAAYLAEVVALVQSEADQLRALKRPSGDAQDRAALSAYFTALGEVVAAYRQLEAAAQARRRTDDGGRRGDAAGQSRRRARRQLWAAGLWHSGVDVGVSR